MGGTGGVLLCSAALPSDSWAQRAAGTVEGPGGRLGMGALTEEARAPGAACW